MAIPFFASHDLPQGFSTANVLPDLGIGDESLGNTKLRSEQKLVGGFHPSKKYARQIENLLQIGVKIKNISLHSVSQLAESIRSAVVSLRARVTKQVEWHQVQSPNHL